MGSGTSFKCSVSSRSVIPLSEDDPLAMLSP